MNENINLCELLKGHVGETFYSPLCGDVILFDIIDNLEKPIMIKQCNFLQDGKWDNKGEMMIFPSKDQRDWNKWAEEQKPKTPKTWSELIKAQNVKTLGVSTIESPYCSISIVASDKRRETIRETTIEKSALALIKIHQLIEVGYGGNITNEEWRNSSMLKHTIKVCCTNIVLSWAQETRTQVAFHTKKQAEEFLSYPENVQLLKDYYMI